MRIAMLANSSPGAVHLVAELDLFRVCVDCIHSIEFAGHGRDKHRGKRVCGWFHDDLLLEDGKFGDGVVDEGTVLSERHEKFVTGE